MRPRTGDPSRHRTPMAAIGGQGLRSQGTGVSPGLVREGATVAEHDQEAPEPSVVGRLANQEPGALQMPSTTRRLLRAAAHFHPSLRQVGGLVQETLADLPSGDPRDRSGPGLDVAIRERNWWSGEMTKVERRKTIVAGGKDSEDLCESENREASRVLRFDNRPKGEESRRDQIDANMDILLKAFRRHLKEKAGKRPKPK